MSSEETQNPATETNTPLVECEAILNDLRRQFLEQQGLEFEGEEGSAISLFIDWMFEEEGYWMYDEEDDEEYDEEYDE